MKFRVLVLGLMILCSVLFVFLQQMNLPQIELPKFAQHNTIGELPIVEMADDGDFYEVDGDEEKARIQKMLKAQAEYEAEYRSCLDKIDKQCGQGSNDKYIYEYYPNYPRAQYFKNPNYIENLKADKCREKRADKCYKKLVKQTDSLGYRFWPTTGFFYFKSHGDKCGEEWLSCEDGYMGTYVWAPNLESTEKNEKKDQENLGNGGNFK